MFTTVTQSESSWGSNGYLATLSSDPVTPKEVALIPKVVGGNEFPSPTTISLGGLLNRQGKDVVEEVGPKTAGIL
jgi:hypothetical protein